MTQKLSASHIVQSASLTCIPSRYVTTFPLLPIDVYSITIANYPELYLDEKAGEYLFEISHAYRGTDERTSSPIFNAGNNIILSGFASLDDGGVTLVLDIPALVAKPVTTNPAIVASTIFNGTTKVVRSSPSSTIIAIDVGDFSDITDVPIPEVMGAITSPLTYNLKNFSVLTCTPDPGPLVANVTVNFDTLEIPWTPGETYTIEVAPGFVKHKFGEQYGNPSFSLPFTTNDAPEIVEYYPITYDGITNWHKSNKLIQLSYSNTPMVKGSGDIKLYKVNSGGADILKATFSVPSDSRVTIDSNPYKININTIGLIEENSTYYVKIDEATFQDYDNFDSVGVNDSTTIRFSTNEVQFPGLKAGIIVFSALSDVAKRIRASGVSINSSASLVVSYLSLVRISCSMASTFSTGAVVERIMGAITSTMTSSFSIPPFITKKTAPASAALAVTASMSQITITKVYTPTYSLVSPSTSTSLGEFGYKVSISGNNIIVTSVSIITSAADDNVGRAYMYNLTTGSFIRTKTNPNIDTFSSQDRFGRACRSNSTNFIIGTIFEDNTSSNLESGVAYVYDSSTGNLIYSKTNPNSYSTSAIDYFGWAVDISDNYFVVGAPGEDTASLSNAGAIYIYSLSTGSLLYTINNSSTNERTRAFGQHVACTDVYTVVSTEQGSLSSNSAPLLWVYSTSTGALLRTIPAPESTEVRCEELCIDGDRIAVASYLTQAVYFFSASTGELLEKITSPAINTTGGFGRCISISGNLAVIGASDKNTGEATINAYLYNVSTGELLGYFPDQYPTTPEGGGKSVDIVGNDVIISNPYEQVPAGLPGVTDGVGTGVVYIYKNVS